MATQLLFSPVVAACYKWIYVSLVAITIQVPVCLSDILIKVRARNIVLSYIQYELHDGLE